MSSTTLPTHNKSSSSGNQPTKKSKGKQQPPEKNPRFQDVEATGRWGSNVSKMELIGVIVLVVIVIGAAIGSIVALTGGSSSSEPSLQAAAPPPAPTPTPTQGPESSPAERLDALRVELGKIEALNVEEYPADLEFYSNLAPDASNVGHLAVQWVVSEDPAEVRVYSQTNIEHLVSRFGLASLYLALGGPNWVSSDKWMTDAPVCEWEGVECNKNSQQIEELDLSNNNLKGMLPMEMVVLQSIKKLFLRQNSIEGPLGGFLGQLPNLTALFLNDNLLEGDIPDELAAGGNLNALFLQQNQLKGSLPFAFCPDFSDEPLVLTGLGIDCSFVTCKCCTEAYDWKVPPCY